MGLVYGLALVFLQEKVDQTRATAIAENFRVIAATGLDGVIRGELQVNPLKEVLYNADERTFVVHLGPDIVRVRESDGRVVDAFLASRYGPSSPARPALCTMEHLKQLLDKTIIGMGFPELSCRLNSVKSSPGRNGPISLNFWPVWHGVRFSFFCQATAVIDDEFDRVTRINFEVPFQPPLNERITIKREDALAAMLEKIFTNNKVQIVIVRFEPEPVIGLARGAKTWAPEQRGAELAMAWEASYPSEIFWEGAFYDPESWSDRTKSFIATHFVSVGARDGKVAWYFPPQSESQLGERADIVPVKPLLKAQNTIVTLFEKGRARRVAGASLEPLSDLGPFKATLDVKIGIGSTVWRASFDKTRNVVQAYSGSMIKQFKPNLNLSRILEQLVKR